MAKLLQDRGHEIVTAVDGLSALDVLKTFVPDVIFCDLVMPNIGGEKFDVSVISKLSICSISESFFSNIRRCFSKESVSDSSIAKSRSMAA